MEFVGRHSHDRFPLSRAGIACLFLSQEQVYLRLARNATTFKHLLAHFSYIVARMLQDLMKERSGERKKNDRQCSDRVYEKADSLKAPGSVASFLRNSTFYMINHSPSLSLPKLAWMYHLLQKL